MSDLDDFDLGRTEGPEGGPPPARRRGFPVVWFAGLVMLVAVLGGLGYLAYRRARAPAAAPSPGAPLAGPATPVPSPTLDATDLPPLDESDALVRELARGLSAHPRLAAWLAARGLVRTFAAVVENVADGEPPRAHLGFLAPKGSFAVVRKQGRLVIDPRSYARYDAFAEAVASLDAAGCARVYRRLDPLFEAAHRELGHPEGGFSRTLARAMAALQATPVLEGDVPVRPVAPAMVVYEFVDPRLEALSPAQKHLLRMGPRNVRRVQAKLRELSERLGLSEAR